MRGFVSFVVCAVIIGCGSDHNSGIKTKAIVPDVAPSTGFPVLEKPAASDPAALAIVAKIVDHHTGKNPAMLEKMKSCNFGREGKFKGVESVIAIQFQLKAVWPDRGRYFWTGLESYPFTLRFFDKQIIKDVPSMALSAPAPEKLMDGFTRHFNSDMYQLLLPFADKNLTVAKGPDFKLGEKTYPSVRIWLPEKPQAIFYYDPATYRVERIAYDGRENGMPTYIELAFSDFRPTNGFLLPHHLHVRMNQNDFMEFDKASLEFPIDHPAKIFTDP